MQVSLDQVKAKLSSHNALFITNRSSFLRNGFDKILASENHIIYNEFELNPKLDDLIVACNKFQLSKFDYIVGVGGGSAMDFAKSLFYFLEKKLSDPADYIKQVNSPQELKTDMKLILIPTTAGSGSEATHFSVLYHEKKKYSFAHESLRPHFVVLDPIFTKNLPSKVTAYTGMDAICHAIESYWAKAATRESKEYALSALKLLVPHIKAATFNPTALSRMAMLEGAYFAGKAIDISKTTAAHAFSYYLTTHFHIPHGQAVAVMLPYFLEVNGNFPQLEEIFETKNLKESFVNLLNELELNLDINELIKDRDHFINSVNLQRLANNPVQFSLEELREIFY